ncbi:hypothetical protein [Saccharopolyspora halophila]
MARSTRTALAVLGWLAASGIAVALGLVAVSALGRGILDPGPPITKPSDVAAELSRPAPARTETAPEASPGAEPLARHVERTPGGTAVTGCDASGRTMLVSWSPAQGFRADDINDGPDDEAEMTFTSADTDVDISVECSGGRPRTTVEVDG